MRTEDVKKQYTIPVEGASYPKGPYHFADREFLIVKFETDIKAIRAVVPEPLEVSESVASFEVIHMPDSSGFGSYTESGITVPVKYNGDDATFIVNMFLNDHPPIAAGREIWGFPKKWGEPNLRVVRDQVVGTLDYSGVRVATATMAYKYEQMDSEKVKEGLGAYNYNLKVIPSVDGSVAISQLIRYKMEDIDIKWAWKGPAALDIRPCALAPIYKFPVISIIEGYHVLTDLTLPYGEVVYDYLSD
ncbi:MAG: acetoacetate decarboxylase [Deltaproteobacteria bacterium]